MTGGGHTWPDTQRTDGGERFHGPARFSCSNTGSALAAATAIAAMADAGDARPMGLRPSTDGIGRPAERRDGFCRGRRAEEGLELDAVDDRRLQVAQVRSAVDSRRSAPDQVGLDPNLYFCRAITGTYRAPDGGPMGERRRIVLGCHRWATHQWPRVVRWRVPSASRSLWPHRSGWRGGADSLDDPGPADDAGEEVEVVTERGPAAVWLLEVGAAPLLHCVGQVEEVVEACFEGHRPGSTWWSRSASSSSSTSPGPR